jgi:uncharacterized protein YqgC (DUF456 family)
VPAVIDFFTQTFTPELISKTLALTFMFFGLLVLLIPILPGLVIIWAAGLGYGLFIGFTTLGWVMFALMTVLMIVGSFIDNVLMGTSAHKEGAPWWVVLLALLFAILGNFLLPIIGGVLAALLVLFLLQWARLKDARQAFTSLKGFLVGCGWSVGIRFIMGMVMIGLWLIWAWA